MKEVLVLGLNPAWQRLFELPVLELGGVHRLGQAYEFASGKGVNCARSLQTGGISPVLAHFLGGATGQRVAQDLESCGMEQLMVPIVQPTRICTTLTVPQKGDFPGSSTELIEQSPSIDIQEGARFHSLLQAHWSRFGFVAVCGSFPQGLDDSVLGALPVTGKRLFIDALNGVDSWMEQGVELLKVNIQELVAIGARLGADFSLFCQDPVGVCRLLKTFWPLRHLVVTLGAGGALFVDESDQAYYLPVMDGLKMYNAIGAGDAFLAGWMGSAIKGESGVESFCWAFATAQARCEVALPWMFSPQRVVDLALKIKQNMEVRS